MSERFAEVRDWIAGLYKTNNFRIETRTVRHPVLGENTVPHAVWLDNLDNAVQIIGKQKPYRQFVDLIEQTRQQQPALLPWLGSHPLKALELAGQWRQLLAVIEWLQAHPKPAIYLRQADILGVDTKFIEHYRSVLITLLDRCLPDNSINPDATGVNQFEARYGFRQKPLRVRFRILDPDFNLLPGSNSDISLTQQGFHDLGHHPEIASRIEYIFITENETNFLAFPQICNSLVLFGAGYGFEALSGIPWLARPEIHYWGDIDTHGFAILDQLRNHQPQVRSLLMDKHTLLAHQSFWTHEMKPETRPLARLTGTERQLYEMLGNNTFGDQIRLEQERIGFNHILKSLRQIAVVID